MSIKSLFNKIKRITISKILTRIYSKIRVIKYKLLSDCKNVSGKPIFNSPALMRGQGEIRFGEKVYLGVTNSPSFLNTYIYIEARTPISNVIIEDGVRINNNASLISDGAGIKICSDTLIGFNFSVLDTDFHDLHPEKRLTGTPVSKKVLIGSNVFIGSNVIILKGVEIGCNSVIASGSVVTKSIPENVIAGGNPCKVIKEINL